ncbi:hypothetical protein [Mucisphaera calidilacus]|uniref:Uncharacterized protein n=1 Tax=Mucisphaera calidilacus TaxID=2527982 RepID=A0A518BYC7_9BACT|nr:hypothetical protein [Mucisphaera calidilacus]QDU71980.1 hypothetical protein Pan265_18390 [Mucisphaera calidilacus]
MSTNLLNTMATLAQDVAALKDPAIPRWIVIIACVMILIFLGWGSFMNSKRTHQD